MRAAVVASAHTVAVSAPLAQHMRRDLFLPADRVVTIPNGVRWVKPDRVTLREELRLQPDDRVLVAVGNLYPVKGHVHLIDALARLAATHPRLHVAIGGRGQLEESLKARAREHGIGDRVHLLGLRSDVAAVLAAADVFVLPSLSEGLPLALLEAMFAGCAIVATDVGEVRLALDRGTAGVLVEPANPGALAAAIDRLLLDAREARRLGDRAAAHARAEYDLSTMIERYVTIYEAALRTAAGKVPDLSPGAAPSM
jgi:glycosyltransferase involved in cell wall biosynthesis